MNSDRKKYPLLKRLVLSTSFGPFKSFYIALYRLVLWWVAKELYKDPAIDAVYVRNGITRGEIVPGISDIDLLMILRDDVELPPDAHLDRQNLVAFAQRYKLLARQLPLLDENFYIVPAARLEEEYLTAYNWRYTLMVVRQTDGLLRGRDYIGELPDMPEPIRRGALLSHIEKRWMLFVENFLMRADSPKDGSARSSMCYRYCCDVLRLALDFRTGEQTLKRTGVVRRALPYLEGQDRTFADKLINLEERRFLADDETLVEETKDFLLRQYNHFYRGIEPHPYAQPLQAMEHLIDYRAEEHFGGGVAEDSIEQLLGHIESQWQDRLLGAYLVSSCFFEIDDCLLLLQVDDQQLPSMGQLLDLYRAHGAMQEQVPRSVHLFLLMPNAACCMRLEGISSRNRPAILPQVFVPDIFYLIRDSACVMRPGAYTVWAQPRFTVQSGCFFWSQLRRYRLYLQAQCTKLEPAPVFLRQWWKWLQLEVIQRGIAAGHMRYPLTLAAIGRGLEAVGLPRPAALGALADAYCEVALGRSVDIEAVAPEALDYVRAVDPTGHVFSGPPPWLADNPRTTYDEKGEEIDVQNTD